jgi:hypothetical protein
MRESEQEGEQKGRKRAGEEDEVAGSGWVDPAGWLRLAGSGWLDPAGWLAPAGWLHVRRLEFVLFF